MIRGTILEAQVIFACGLAVLLVPNAAMCFYLCLSEECVWSRTLPSRPFSIAKTPWRKWGPYLSERQWGTVREDYSQDGNAWDHFTHDMTRSHAYRWGEDGLAGISDDNELLCFSVALWNGKDPRTCVRPDQQRGQPRRRS